MGESSPISKGTAASATSIGGAALAAFSSIEKGFGDEAGDEYKALKAERSAEFGRFKAQTTDVIMREQLNTTLSNIDVIRAAAHADPTSPTGAAVSGYAARIADRDRNFALLNINNQILQDEADARYLHQAGKYARELGYVNAGVSIASSIGKAVAGLP